MKEYTTSQRLKSIMDEMGLRQVDILNKCKPYCEKYGIRLAKNDLSQYVSGKVEPLQDRLTILALALNVSEPWLMGYNVPKIKSNNITPIETKRFPLLGEIACGEPRFTNEHFESYIEAGANIQADFCLKAKGDSMINARIHDGDIVFIRKQDIVENGDIAAVVVNNDSEATLKRFFYYQEKALLILKAENPNYKDLEFSDEQLNSVHILGKAVAFQSDVK